jgi:adenylate cyclase
MGVGILHATRWKQLLRKLHPAYLLLAPLLLSITGFIAHQTPLFHKLENTTIDWRFQTRPLRPGLPGSDLLVVRIDERCLAQIGAWPWPRRWHGDFLKITRLEHPSVIAFDLLFSEPGPADNDTYFADAAADTPQFLSAAALSGPISEETPPGIPEPSGPTPVLHRVQGDLSKLYGTDHALVPFPALRARSRFGFVDSPVDPHDGIRRELPLLVRVSDRIYPTFSTLTLMQHWNLSPDQVEVRLGDSLVFHRPQGAVRVPISERGTLYLNYRNWEDLPTIPYSTLLANLASIHLKQEPRDPALPEVRDRIVVCGQWAIGLTDLGPSPLDPQTRLVMTHVTALRNMLEGDYLSRVPAGPVWFGWLVAAWAVLGWVRSRTILLAVLAPVTAMVLYLAAAWILFARAGLELPLAAPLAFFALLHFGSIVIRWFEEERSKREIKGIFSSYLARDVMEKLLAHPESIRLGGDRRPVAVLFSDIRGFTRLSEGSDEAALVAQLNEYFEEMVGAVNRHKGTLHKYIGDSIMAVWGDVIDRSPAENATLAARAALDMQAALTGLNERWRQSGRPCLQMGIGIHYGPVLVGNIGAVQRREFTVIGDVVNVASRLEGSSKHLHAGIVVSGALEGHLDAAIPRRPLGPILLQGKTEPTRAWELASQPPAWWTPFREGWTHYENNRFSEALPLLEEAARSTPDDPVLQQAVHNCRQWKSSPPPDGWSHVHILDHK